MNLYKVAFDEKGAVSAEQLLLPQPGSVRLETVKGQHRIKWLSIHADNEQESIQIANTVVADFFHFLKAS